MTEENDDLADDEANQCSTPDWTRLEDEENMGNDPFKEAKNVHQGKAAYVKQDLMQKVNGDGDGDLDDATAVTGDLDWRAPIDLREQDGVCALTSTSKWSNSESHQHTALHEKIRDLKGKDIVVEEEPITGNVIEDDAVDVIKKQQESNVVLSGNAASTSQYAAVAYENAKLSQNADKLDNAKINVRTSGSQAREEHAQGPEQHGSKTPNLFAAGSSSQNASKILMLNFMDSVQMYEVSSTPDWHLQRYLSAEEVQAIEERIMQEEQLRKAQEQGQHTSSTPDWFVPAAIRENNRNACMKETSRRVQETFREEMEEAPAMQVPATEKESNRNACMNETTRRFQETIREEMEEATDMPHVKLPTPHQGNQTFMYPLPDMPQILKLPIYNTYHHHHVHELRKGNSNTSCPKSTSTDPSYHTHTSQHRTMKVETRFFTFNCDSSVVAYFRNNKINIRVTSTQPATYTTVVVKHDLLEFVHHIVHRHDVHIINSKYQDYFNLTSVCSQTCTRTKTQCRLFGPVGDFFHTHFHEFIHTIFVSAPIEEDATVYSQYLPLGTIHRPERKQAENRQTEHEMNTGNPASASWTV